MRIVSKLYLSFGILLAIALGGGALAVFGAREGSYHVTRTNLAHQNYEAYLSLSNYTYQLFKQLGDAMLIGDKDFGAEEAALFAKIQTEIERIRRITAAEIKIAGDEEIPELEHLEKIESKIEQLEAAYVEVAKSRNRDEFSNYWARLSRMLDETLDEDFNQLIKVAILDEAEEVEEARAAMLSMIQTFQILAAVFSLIAIAAAVASVWILRRDLREPILKLVGGASALARGNLEHRIEVDGRNELHEVARAFNKMAQEISTRQQTLADSNIQLEKAVSERTAELERLLDALRDSDQNRRQFLADVSHELRTPLTIIRGEADIALRGQEKPEEYYRDALDKIREAVVHTANLVDDLLFVARQEAGEVRLKLDTVDLSKLLPKVIEQHSTVAKENNANVAYAGDVKGALVRADAGRVRQVVLILLENAMRYGGGSIEVALHPAPGGFGVSVSDDGPGMTEDEQARAFERFFRGSDAARYHEGAGLGLPMAKAIVEAHGGEIALTSAPGSGLIVSFTLPKRAKLEAVA
ncbi:MAG: HAMP domain-containing histidine kinase [Alphaproteobacteria bacterium]|nr:HAMP domain-containing histidine kinase [Alphaproteobacteria bacterium]